MLHGVLLSQMTFDYFEVMYPQTRMQRTRSSKWIRDTVSETSIFPHNLIYPIFIIPGINTKIPINKMPGIYRLTIDLAVLEVKLAWSLGIQGITLFPVIPEHLKDENGSQSYNDDNLITQAIKTIKDAVPEVGIICDVALDPYTTHGHDGILKYNTEFNHYDNHKYVSQENIHNTLDNDLTIKALIKQSICLANAGADMIAPSDMMDGRIMMIRNALDQNSYSDIPILSYAVKYASSLYGPFRDAIQSNILNKNKDIVFHKKTYQMDPRNKKEAIREIELDINEGTDIVMVKPATLYLDIINRASNAFNIPIFAYHVSGEYAMLWLASEYGCIDFYSSLLETLISIRRAGATSILTYGAIEAAKLLNS